MARPPAQIAGKLFKPTAAAIAAAGAIALGLGHKWEGIRYYAYDDMRPSYKLKVGDEIKGTLTVCRGHTDAAGGPPIVIGKRYTDAECDAYYTADLAMAHRIVLSCTPELYYNPHTAGAIIDFAYNYGPRYCLSTMSKDFRAGRIESGCKRLLDFKYSGGKFVQGLLNRRHDEFKTCVKELS